MAFTFDQIKQSNFSIPLLTEDELKKVEEERISNNAREIAKLNEQIKNIEGKLKIANEKIKLQINERVENYNEMKLIDQNLELTLTPKINRQNIEIYQLINSALYFHYYIQQNRLNDIASNLNKYYKDKIKKHLFGVANTYVFADHVFNPKTIFCFNQYHSDYSAYDKCTLIFRHMFSNQAKIPKLYILLDVLTNLSFAGQVTLRYDKDGKDITCKYIRDMDKSQLIAEIVKNRPKFTDRIIIDEKCCDHEKTLTFENKSKILKYYLDKSLWDAIYDVNNFNLQNKIMTLVYSYKNGEFRFP